MRRCLMAVALGLLACEAPKQDREVWRFSIEETRGSVQDAYAQRFAELVAERSGGEVEVKVYPYGTLGTSDQTTELLHNGTLQLAMASPGHLGKLIPEVQVFLLHFVLDDDPEVASRTLADEGLRAHFAPLYAAKNFQLLDFYSEGEMVWTTRKPIRKPADFAGVKIRVMTSPLLMAAYDAYGANPTPLPYAEVYSALQLNMIDGQVNPVFAIEEMSFYEVTDFLVFPGHSRFVTSVAANQDFYADLSPQRRALLEGVVRELHDEVFALQTRYNRERLDAMLEARPSLTVLRLEDEEREVFAAAAEAAHALFVERVGPTADAALQALAAATARNR